MKLPHVLRGVALFVAVTLTASACGGDSNSIRPADATDDQAATMADRSLGWDQLDDLLPDGANTVASRVATSVEDWLISQAVELELADRGYPITDEDLDQAAEFVGEGGANRSDTERDLFVQTVALTFAAGRWSDDAAADLDDPVPPDYLCANHILLETEEEAQAALERVEAGEDFAELAIELSTGPSGPSGGDLGCVVRGQFVPEFEEAAYAASAGEVVGPVETQFGWHLIEVESVGPATPENHPTADPAELEQLLAQVREIQIAALVQGLQDDATAAWSDDATIDPSIGTLDPGTLTIIVP